MYIQVCLSRYYGLQDGVNYWTEREIRGKKEVANEGKTYSTNCDDLDGQAPTRQIGN